MNNKIAFIHPEILYDKLISFIHDYFDASGFENAVVAVSGGIDSACIAYLLKDILHPKHVTSLFLPSDITGDESKICYELVKNDCHFEKNEIINIQPFLDMFSAQVVNSYDTVLRHKNKLFSDDSAKMHNKLRLGNIAARIRMILTYDTASKYNALVVGTENKTECCLGYSTQWGDSAAAIHPMGDMYKTEVFAMAKHLKIPEKIIQRTPTAELWENQTDEGEIGLTYSVMDQILLRKIEYNYTDESLLKEGFQLKQIKHLSFLINRSEYKRRLPLTCSLKDQRENI